MALLLSNEKVRSIMMREDYNLQPMQICVDEFASNIITIKKNGARDKSWLFPHQLLKKCYNIPGIPDGSKVLLISPRDVRFDPLHQLDDSWSDVEVKDKMSETAKEQQHKADAKKGSQATNMTMVLLSSAVVILVLAIGFIVLMNYYGG